MFLILTGFHGCHVFGGVTYLSAILGRSVRGTGGAIITASVAVVGAILALIVTSLMHAALRARSGDADPPRPDPPRRDCVHAHNPRRDQGGAGGALLHASRGRGAHA